MIVTKYFEVDLFIEEIITHFKSFPEMQSLLQKYQRLLRDKNANYEENVLKQYSLEDMLQGVENQSFTKAFPLGSRGELGYYNLTWNVPKLETVIDDFEILPQAFPTDMLAEDAVNNGVNMDKIDTSLKNEKPVIIVHHPTARHWNKYSGILVDGNHRVLRNKKVGKLKTLACRLEAPFHIKGLFTELDVFLYKLISNVEAMHTALTVLKQTTSKNKQIEIKKLLPKMLYEIN